MTELITPPGVPVSAGLYSPGLLSGDWIFRSGQGGFDPETGELVGDNTGASLDDVVSCLVHLSDLGQFAGFNAGYAR